MGYLMVLEEELSCVQEKDTLGLQIGNTEVWGWECSPWRLNLASPHSYSSECKK